MVFIKAIRFQPGLALQTITSGTTHFPLANAFSSSNIPVLFSCKTFGLTVPSDCSAFSQDLGMLAFSHPQLQLNCYLLREACPTTILKVPLLTPSPVMFHHHHLVYSFQCVYHSLVTLYCSSLISSTWDGI